MKRLIVAFAAMIFFASQAHSQLLNPGLEVWVKDTFETSVQVQGIPVTLTAEHKKPEHWSSANQFTKIEDSQGFIDLDKTVVEKDSNSFTGTYAAKLTTKTISTPQGQINAPGAISNGTLGLDFSGAQDFSFANILDNVSGGNAIQARPSRLTGYYKYSPAGNDSLLISVQAKSWNASKGESEVVGEGTFITGDTQSTYKQFDVPVSYTSCVMPDTVLVNISGGISQQSTPGTQMFVDSLHVDTLDPQANFPPFANDDDTATQKNNAVTVDILDNDVDCDDPNKKILQSTQKISQASNGSVTIQDSTATYTPNSGFSGTDQFTYSIADSNESDTATVTVAVNSAPQAKDDTTYTVTNNSSIQVRVTANDSDPEGHDIAVDKIATSPSNGSSSVVGDDTIEYTPNNGYTGTDQLDYVLCDDATPELCDTATVQFDVVTGIQGPEAKNVNANVFPNPVQDNVFVDLDIKQTNANNNYQFRVMSTTGKTLKAKQIQQGQSSVDVSGLSQGLYLFEIITQEAELIERGKFSIAN